MKRYYLFIFLLLATVLSSYAQMPFGRHDTETAPITWHANARMTSDTAGTITLTAEMADGWHLYGMTMPADGPKPTRIKFDITPDWSLDGAMTVDKAAKEKFDPMFNTTVEYWEGKIIFKQHFKISSQNAKPNRIKCTISYMGCNDATCLPPAQKTLDIRVLPKK